jgi:hypothetical protein
VASSRARLGGGGGGASPCSGPFWMGEVTDECLPLRTLLYVSFMHVLVSLDSFRGAPNSTEVMCHVSLLAESWAFSGSAIG